MSHLSGNKAQLSALKVSLRYHKVPLYDVYIRMEDLAMCKLPQGTIRVRRGQQRYRLWLTPAIHALLLFYAQDARTSITDAGNRIILGFLTEHYGYETPGELHKKTLEAIFPNKRAIYDALVSIAHGKKLRRRPIPLRKDGKLPSFLTEPISSDHGNP